VVTGILTSTDIHARLKQSPINLYLELSSMAMCSLNIKIVLTNAFEMLAAGQGVTIKHCHAENGVFDARLFKADVEVCQHTISFCVPDAPPEWQGRESHTAWTW